MIPRWLGLPCACNKKNCRQGHRQSGATMDVNVSYKFCTVRADILHLPDKGTTFRSGRRAAWQMRTAASAVLIPLPPRRPASKSPSPAPRNRWWSAWGVRSRFAPGMSLTDTRLISGRLVRSLGEKTLKFVEPSYTPSQLPHQRKPRLNSL